MTFTAGTKLGPYEIVQAIGAGGMGQVFKARDTRLNRFVAIKVLPEHVSQNQELKARFPGMCNKLKRGNWKSNVHYHCSAGL